MAFGMLTLVFLGVILLPTADAVAYFSIEPKNKVIEPGYTMNMSMNCHTQVTHYQHMSIVSIIISKGRLEGNDTEFSDIVSISSPPSGDHIEDYGLGGATANGTLKGDYPYLKAFWTAPSTSEAGIYQCAIYSLDRTGRPRVDTNTAEIQATVPDTGDLIFKVLRLQEANDYLLRRFEDNFGNDTDDGLPNFSSVSSIYRHRRYYVSQDTDLIKEAETNCELEGGYLAEINDADEFNFIQTFLNGQNILEDVIVGATREDSIVWVHVFSNKTVTYFNWTSGGPGAEDCIVLREMENWKFRQTDCEYYHLSLCEIPR